jgi:DNA repair protein RadC
MDTTAGEDASPLLGPRERLLHVGIDSLSNEELIALLLGTGNATESVKVLATRLLEEYGTLDGLARAGIGELRERRGVGQAKAARIAAAIELGRRAFAATQRPASVRFLEGRAVQAWAKGRLSTLDHEELWILALDGSNGLRAARRVATGGLHGIFVSARDPLRIALREGASAFILVHNHPSGDPTPSREDIEFTERIAHAADVVATPLLDHVVVARAAFISMLEHRMVPARAPRGPHPLFSGLATKSPLSAPPDASLAAKRASSPP